MNQDQFETLALTLINSPREPIPLDISAYQQLLFSCINLLIESSIDEIKEILDRPEDEREDAIKAYLQEYHVCVAYTDLDYTSIPDHYITKFNHELSKLLIKEDATAQKMKILLPKVPYLLVFCYTATNELELIKIPMKDGKAHFFGPIDFHRSLCGNITNNQVHFNFIFLLESLRVTLNKGTILRSDSNELAKKFNIIKEKIPGLYEKIIRHSTILNTTALACEDVNKSKFILRKKLLDLRDACIIGGSKTTGSQWASAIATIRIAEFVQLVEQVFKGSEYQFLTSLVAHFRAQDCVETGASKINTILSNSSYKELLDKEFDMPTADKQAQGRIIKSFLEAVTIPEGQAIYNNLPEKFLEQSIQELTYNSIEDLGFFFQNLAYDKYEIIIKGLPNSCFEEINRYLRNFLVFLNSEQKNIFIKIAFDNDKLDLLRSIRLGNLYSFFSVWGGTVTEHFEFFNEFLAQPWINTHIVNLDSLITFFTKMNLSKNQVLYILNNYILKNKIKDHKFLIELFNLWDLEPDNLPHFFYDLLGVNFIKKTLCNLCEFEKFATKMKLTEEQIQSLIMDERGAKWLRKLTVSSYDFIDLCFLAQLNTHESHNLFFRIMISRPLLESTADFLNLVDFLNLDKEETRNLYNDYTHSNKAILSVTDSQTIAHIHLATLLTNNLCEAVSLLKIDTRTFTLNINKLFLNEQGDAYEHLKQLTVSDANKLLGEHYHQPTIPNGSAVITPPNNMSFFPETNNKKRKATDDNQPTSSKKVKLNTP